MLTDRISVNAHSSIRIGSEQVLYVDPFHVTDEPHDADIVFITHDHYDHLSPEDIARVRKETTVFVLPASCRASAEKNGLTNCTYLTPGEQTKVCGVPVEAVAACNTLKPFHPEKNGWLGYVVAVDGQRVYVAGDTDENKDNLAVKCDIALVPVGGTYTFDAKHAAKFVNQLRPSVAIPTHYGDIVGDLSDGDVFADAVDEGIKVVKKI